MAMSKGGDTRNFTETDRERIYAVLALGLSNREVIEFCQRERIRVPSGRSLATYRASERVQALRRELASAPEAAQVLVPALTDAVIRTAEISRRAFAYLIDGEPFQVGGKDIGVRNAITIINDARRFFFTVMGGGEIASDLRSFGKEIEQAAAGMTEAERKELMANVKESQVAVLRKIAEEARRKQEEAKNGAGEIASSGEVSGR